MLNFCSSPFDMSGTASSFMNKSLQDSPGIAGAALSMAKAVQDYWAGVFNYTSGFMVPSINALNAFIGTEMPGRSLERASRRFSSQ